jgi:hypothetical protein
VIVTGLTPGKIENYHGVIIPGPDRMGETVSVNANRVTGETQGSVR